VVPVARLLRDAGAQVRVTYSPGPVGCAELARAAAEAGDVVVAVGGDGMLASLAAAVGEVSGLLGIVPSGRGNDFARMLGVPSDAAALAALLLDGAPRPVDAIACAGRLVLGSVYAGVDSDASEVVDRSHRLPRSLQYPYAAVRALARYRPTRFAVTVDGVRHDERAATVVVANSAFYGAGMRIAPAAVVDDGLLDVVVVRAASRLRLVRALPRLYDGSHVDLDEVLVLRGRDVSLAADEPVTAYGDGERLVPLPLTASVRPAALSVLAPPVPVRAGA
jgi:YegS/Rv2252/BmrU family lipid kinase